MRAVTTEFAAWAASVDTASLPPAVVARTKALVLDLLGNIVRARHDAESTPSLLAAVRAMGLSGEEMQRQEHARLLDGVRAMGATGGSVAVFGDAARYTPAGAALVNGALAHSLDFDDTHAAGSLHPGAPVIPAALAAAELSGASGAVLIAGIVAGYEATNRLALALPAGAHYDRGFHPTATCGVFGGAVAAARVFGLDAGRIEDALGIALSQAAGSLQFLANGAWTKRFQVGWSAMGGLAAALLAREGFRGAAEAIEGRHGFLRAYAPDPVPERVLEDLGTVFELMHTAVKPYPSCRYGHAAIDAALALRARHGLVAEDITKVTVHLPAKGMLLIGAPAEKKAEPRNVVDGQFSGPFVVAAALATGAMGWESYALLEDATVRALARRVSCVQDPEIEAEFPRNMSGRTTVHTARGTFTEKVVVPKGEPDNFMTDAELADKFHGLADAILSPARASGLADAVLSLETAKDVSVLTRFATPRCAVRLAGE